MNDIDTSSEAVESYAAYLDTDGRPGHAALLRALLSERPQWLPIDSAPKGKKIVVAYRNSHGMWRRVMARYYPADTLCNADMDSDEEFAPEGWYEESETHNEQLQSVEHPQIWCDLPPLPAPPQSPGVEE